MDNQTPDSYITRPEEFVTLQELRDYLHKLGPNLKLIEPDSSAFRHLADFGHTLEAGCCRDRLRESDSRSSRA